MAYPTGTLSIVLENVDRRVLSLKGYSQRARDRMAAGDVPSTLIFDLLIRLKSDHAALTEAAATPGIGDYAQQQKDDAALDVAAEFNAMLAAIQDVLDWILANFPKDADGYLLAQTWGDNGPVDREFSSATTQPVRTLLDSLIGTID